MQAALYADAACLALLLNAGANPNLGDSFGATALMWAIPDEKKVDLLLRHGANVNAVSSTGRTPLLVAAGLPGASRIVGLLLDKGADPKVRDKHAEGAVLRAALGHDPETMRLLLSHDLDVNAADADGLSPLMLVAGFADHKLADSLIAHGANLNWKDGDGISALIAFDGVFHDFSMQRKLIARGADYLYAVLVWAPGKPHGLAAEMRRTLAEVDPNLAVRDVQTYSEVIDAAFAQQKMIASLSWLFGVVALVLAVVGLYGVAANGVEQRTGEIGVRIALGADRGSVLLMVLRGAFWQVGIGLALGIAAAIGAGHVIASRLFGVRPWDPLMLSGATLLLGLAALIAGFIPACRAASVDPVQALRSE